MCGARTRGPRRVAARARISAPPSARHGGAAGGGPGWLLSGSEAANQDKVCIERPQRFPRHLRERPCLDRLQRPFASVARADGTSHSLMRDSALTSKTSRGSGEPTPPTDRPRRPRRMSAPATSSFGLFPAPLLHVGGAVGPSASCSLFRRVLPAVAGGQRPASMRAPSPSICARASLAFSVMRSRRYRSKRGNVACNALRSSSRLSLFMHTHWISSRPVCTRSMCRSDGLRFIAPWGALAPLAADGLGMR